MFWPGKIRSGLAMMSWFASARAGHPPGTPYRSAISERVSPETIVYVKHCAGAQDRACLPAAGAGAGAVTVGVAGAGGTAAEDGTAGCANADGTGAATGAADGTD